ncbi:alpha/beta hydrolase [Luteolibacter flavescens]|uniref:Alpha/beta hydrolase n=1 Tax=Luteolibacter flavescens TaxID=1859460 RepID=A0ABT3FSN2_9BACT|nr:alpha/beta hydrolase [Luteolibacter flavescens]MCW1886562.1 alpha/beta hydrolase [Luteolibacter flavescens]
MNSSASFSRLSALSLACIASLGAVAGAEDQQLSNKPAVVAHQGDFQFECAHAGRPIQVFGHRPAAYSGGPVLVLFHGASRDARGYRDGARKLADMLGMLLVVPEFDRERFDVEAYQEGGVMKDGKVLPPAEWTFSYLQSLLDEVFRREGKKLPYYLAGHSAGAQFLVRMAAFHPTEARRMILVNPGSLVFPTRDQPYPYGFGGLPEAMSSDAAIRRYVESPVVFYLGTGDVTKKRLTTGKEAMKQGATRIERGRNCHESGRVLAGKEAWSFRWELAQAEGLEHASAPMWAHAKCRLAMLGEEKEAGASE